MNTIHSTTPAVGIDPDDLFARAVRAYRRFYEGTGLLSQDPNRSLSVVGPRAVILANVRGTLATYKVTPSGRLRRMGS